MRKHLCFSHLYLQKGSPPQLGSFSADPFRRQANLSQAQRRGLYKNAFLGGAFIDPFVQQPEETKLVPVVVVASPTVVSNQIAKAIDAEKSRTGVSFNVKIHAILRVKGGGWEWILSGLQKYEVSVDCEKLKVPFNSSNTTATAGSVLPRRATQMLFSLEV
ncbi:hypothetical protein L3X38_032227 [Prunus dulcis]|uniref:Uncharacterized protein n=1 Tax=Prunus dulcis TaxID=3755 RepID=A0AAD4YVQ4_PRUDU|nr:hypothetical protein L3X38_032227 [Prunus dulcis]